MLIKVILKRFFSLLAHQMLILLPNRRLIEKLMKRLVNIRVIHWKRLMNYLIIFVNLK